MNRYLVLFRLCCFILASSLFINIPALAQAQSQDDSIRYIEGVVLKGENAESILTQYMTKEEFYKLFQSTKSVYDLSRIRQDYSYGLVTSSNSGLKIFEYQIDRSKKVVVVSEDGKYKASIKPVSYEIYPKTVEAAVEAAREQEEIESSKQLSAEDAQLSSDGTSDGKVEEDNEVRIDEKVRKNEHAEAIFSRCMKPGDFITMVNDVKKVYNLGLIMQGHDYTLIYGEKSGFKSFEYQIDKGKKLLITKTKEGYDAQIDVIKYDVKLAVIKGTITSSLFLSMQKAGEDPDLAVIMADIFGSEINFIRDIRSGDSYEVVVEKYYHKGSFQGYGRILGVRFKNRGTVYEGYRFPYAKGVERYYNAKGESLHKTLLKAPLSFTRISSRYNLKRKHPVFHDVRAHLGVDYAAPAGTPVKAVGDGVITKAGWGTGFGRMIVIRHDNGMETM